MDNAECLRRIEILEKQLEENNKKMENLYTTLKLHGLMELLSDED
jgi:hypothetical protein